MSQPEAELQAAVVDRFMSFVEPEMNSGCWLWSGGLGSTGYGGFWLNGKTLKAHRAAWILFNGTIQNENSYHGLCVCHICDTPACVNPFHLFLGTMKENLHDRDRKGRRFDNRGEANGNSPLKNSDVVTIRERFVCGQTDSEVAAIYGVANSTINNIRRGHTWRHIL